MTALRKLVSLIAEAIEGIADGLRRAHDAGVTYLAWYAVVIVLFVRAWA